MDCSQDSSDIAAVAEMENAVGPIHHGHGVICERCGNAEGAMNKEDGACLKFGGLDRLPDLCFLSYRCFFLKHYYQNSAPGNDHLFQTHSHASNPHSHPPYNHSHSKS